MRQNQIVGLLPCARVEKGVFKRSVVSGLILKEKLEFPPPTLHSSDSHDGLGGCPESQMVVSLEGTSQMIKLTTHRSTNVNC